MECRARLRIRTQLLDVRERLIKTAAALFINREIDVDANGLQTCLLQSGPDLMQVSVGGFNFGVANVLNGLQNRRRVFRDDVANGVELDAKVALGQWISPQAEFCD